ncbi:MAG: tocopherol cyclase family protein [Bacteroidota bacterium]
MTLQDRSRRWKALWNPDMYHGWGRMENYFEGWYCKMVSPDEQYAVAVIPGISMGPNGEKHAFIQVLDGMQCKTAYHEYPAEAFQPSPDGFSVQLAGNYFSANKVHLDLPELKGTIEMPNIHPWPKMLGAPGIMGWFSFVPFMQCYHGVVSMGHALRGNLEVYGESVSFDGGKGYMEKDWGVSFPSAWIWTQTNHFASSPGTSLMASVANIPWLGSHFVGYIVGFLHEGQLYRFATYTGAMMQASLEGKKVEVKFKDRRYRLELIGQQAEGGNLISPISGAMTGKVNESLQSTIHVRFFDRDQLIFEETGRHAGLEVAGDVDKLLTERWRR